MIAIAKNSKKTIVIWSMAFSLAISACFLFSLIMRQEAYAEARKVSGTSKKVANLTRSTIVVSNKNYVIESYLENLGIGHSIDFAMVYQFQSDYRHRPEFQSILNISAMY